MHAPLDVFLVRKLGVPHWSELAMGALAGGGGVVMNDDVVANLRVTDEQVREVIAAERAELVRREHAYRGDRPITDPRGKVVILVDDGIATGASMLAAVRAVRAAGPESIVVAFPSGHGPPVASWHWKPMTWCARRCRPDLKPSGRFTPTSPGQ